MSVKKRYSGAERRTQIIKAAIQQFAEKGYGGTRTNEIARTLGISETLIFQHFNSKRELYNVVVEELFRHQTYLPEIGKLVLIKDDYNVFKTLCVHLIRNMRDDPRVIRLAFFSALQDGHFSEIFYRVDELGLPIPEFLNRYIQSRIDDGDFKEVNSMITARLFTDMVIMYCIDQETAMCGPPLPLSDEEAADRIVKIFLNDLQAK